jgi:hypothetical protein
MLDYAIFGRNTKTKQFFCIAKRDLLATHLAQTGCDQDASDCMPVLTSAAPHNTALRIDRVR